MVIAKGQWILTKFYDHWQKSMIFDNGESILTKANYHGYGINNHWQMVYDYWQRVNGYKIHGHWQLKLLKGQWKFENG